MAKVHWEAVQKIAEAHALEDPSSSIPALLRFLRFWWSQKYNRPLKDPLLESYTFDELCYEFLRHFYADPANDPSKIKEEARKKAEEDEWIQKQMSEILSAQDKVSNAAKKIEEISHQMPKPPKESQSEKATEPEPDPFPNLPEFSTKFDPE